MSEETKTEENAVVTEQQQAMSEAAAVLAAGDDTAKVAAEAAKKKGKGKSIPAGIAYRDSVTATRSALTRQLKVRILFPMLMAP